MRINTRDSGIDIIGQVSWGMHFCQFYQEKEDLMDIFIPYFKAGLENREFCIWVISSLLGVDEAKAVLKKFIPESEDYIGREQIEIVPCTKRYAKGDAFESERIMNSWVEKISKVLTNGYNDLRLTEELPWLEWEQVESLNRQKVIESKWSEKVLRQSEQYARLNLEGVIFACSGGE